MDTTTRFIISQGDRYVWFLDGGDIRWTAFRSVAFKFNRSLTDAKVLVEHIEDQTHEL